MPENWHGAIFFIVEREVKNKKAEDRGWGTWKSLGSDLLLPLIHKNTALMHWIYLWRIRLNTAFQCLEAYIISGIFFHIFLKDALIWNIKWFRNSILFMSSVIFSILLLKKLRVNGGSSSSFFFFFFLKSAHHSAERLVVMRVKKSSSSMRCGELVGLERTVSFLLEIGFINLLYYTLLGSFINNESNTRQNFLRELETLWLELNLGIWGCVYECYLFCKMLWAPSMGPNAKHCGVLKMYLFGAHVNISAGTRAT